MEGGGANGGEEGKDPWQPGVVMSRLELLQADDSERTKLTPATASKGRSPRLCSRHAGAAALSSRDHDSEAASVAFARLIRASWVCLLALCPDFALRHLPGLAGGS